LLFSLAGNAILFMSEWLGQQRPGTREQTMSSLVKAALLLSLLLTGSAGIASTVNVAVASNFKDTLQRISVRFRSATGHELRISSASTGKLYAQIVHGAPYDVFLAADGSRPERLVQEGLAVKGSRKTYALGRLVLWSTDRSVQGEGPLVLERGEFRRLAIANPATAPYGEAAMQVLEKLGLWHRYHKITARGENIGQVFQYVASGAADIGFVSLSQLRLSGRAEGYQWPVPQSLYQPIRQQGVLLERSRDYAAALQFMEFLAGEEAVQLIRAGGYGLPEDRD